MKDEENVDVIIIDELDSGFCDEVASLPGGENIRKCFACGTCAAGCPVTDIDNDYNSRKIIRQTILGMRDDVLRSPVIWFCILCYRCYARCPQQVNFTDIMKTLRYLSIKYGCTPPDMLSNSEDCDRLAQMVRRDIILGTIEGRKQVMEEIRARFDKLPDESRP